MRKFDIVKTLQLVVFAVLAAAAITVIVQDDELYQAIATNPHVRALSIILWAVLALSFVFMMYDFASYSSLKRENVELDNAVYHDNLTGIANRYSCDAHIARYAGRPVPPGMACVTMDLTSLKDINTVRGHEGGDEAIRAFSRILEQASGGRCFVGRNGGNKFLSIFDDASRERVGAFVTEVKRGVDEFNANFADAPIRYATGAALASEETAASTLPQLVALSDRRAVGEEG